MIPNVLMLGALAIIAVAALLLLSVGMPFRVGRLLAGTRETSIEEAIEFGRRGRKTYIRVTGRISSDEEFPDENERPLVFRRKRLEVADSRGRWQTISDVTEAVPFGIETRSSAIAVDVDAVGAGLVAIPRESVGKLSDLPAEIVDASDQRSPDAPARLVIEQLSAVEHATACGVPVMRDGRAVLTSGWGARPLIVTTLDIPAAMRLLARGHRTRIRLSTAALVLGVLMVILGAGMSLARL